MKPKTKWTRDHKTRGKAQEPGEPDVIVVDLGKSGILSDGSQKRTAVEAAESESCSANVGTN